MMLIWNSASAARALADDLDPRLRELLERLFAHADRHGLADMTEYLVVEPGDTEADIAREVGLSPLVEPMDGARFGEPGFAPSWDGLADRAGWFEMVVTYGSTFATVLLIRDAEGVIPDLLDLCRRHAAA